MRLQARAWARARPKPDPTRQSGRLRIFAGPSPPKPDPTRAFRPDPTRTSL
ncbi:hypothetical protein B0H10DRAFT_2112918, partial [Mycena sp. CBHHK59/15]